MTKDTSFTSDQIWQLLQDSINDQGSLVVSTEATPNNNSNMPGVRKFGRRTIGNNSTDEDLCDIAANAYPFPAGILSALTVVSNDPQDNPDGSGAGTTTLFGLDEFWAYQTETLNNNGVTPVSSTKLWRRVYRGRAPGNAGTITVADSGTTYMIIAPGIGSSRLCVYTIREGYYGNLVGFSGQLSGTPNGSIILSIFTREFGSDGWTEMDAGSCSNAKDWRSLPALERFPNYLPSKCDIRMTKTDTSAAATVTGNLYIKEYPIP